MFHSLSYKKKYNFLKKNGTIGGKNQILTVAVLKETSRFYSTRIKELKISELNSKKKIKKLVFEKDKIVNNWVISLQKKILPLERL